MSPTSAQAPPRLTTMLRALTARGAAFDPEVEYIARAKILEERRKAAEAEVHAAGAVGASGARRSGLAQELLGTWERGEPQDEGSDNPDMQLNVMKV